MKSKQGVVAFLLLCGLLVSGLWWSELQAGAKEYPGVGAERRRTPRLNLKRKVLPPSHKVGVFKENPSAADLHRHIPNTPAAHAKGLGLLVGKADGGRELLELPLDEFLADVRRNEDKSFGGHKDPPAGAPQADESTGAKPKEDLYFSPFLQYETFCESCFPQKTIGLLRFKTAGGSNKRCSATLISPTFILTAGHCVHEGNGGDYYTDFEFEVGHTSTHTGKKYKGLSPVTFWAWANNYDFDYDLGFVQLEGAPGNENGWMDMGWSNDITSEWWLNSWGYPAQDRNRQSTTGMFATYCTSNIGVFTEQLKNDDCSNYPGSSGSQVFAHWPSTDTYIIYGVASYQVGGDGHTGVDGEDYNGVARITQSKLTDICSILEDEVC